MKIKSIFCRVVEGQEFEKYVIWEEIYDDYMDLVNRISYHENGSLLTHEEMQYEEKQLMYHKILNYELKTVEEKYYSYKGRQLLGEKVIYDSGAEIITRYQYNENGEIVLTLVTDEENSFLGEERVTINGNEKIIEYIDDQNFKFREETIKLNKNWEMIERITRDFYPDDTKDSSEDYQLEEFEYDSRQNLIVNRYFIGEVKRMEVTYSYDSKDRCIKEEVWDIEKEKMTIIASEYDARNNLISETTTEDDVVIEKLKLTYDSMNQMIQQDHVRLEMDNYPYQTRYYTEYST
ncbi:MAG: hypothetical protein AAGA77_25305 [Bacteroidota bacterium]